MLWLDQCCASINAVQEHLLTTLCPIKPQAKQLLTALCLDQACSKITLIMLAIAHGVKSATRADILPLLQYGPQLIIRKYSSPSTQGIRGRAELDLVGECDQRSSNNECLLLPSSATV
jgi:hypothetical protein